MPNKTDLRCRSTQGFLGLGHEFTTFRKCQVFAPGAGEFMHVCLRTSYSYNYNARSKQTTRKITTVCTCSEEVILYVLRSSASFLLHNGWSWLSIEQHTIYAPLDSHLHRLQQPSLHLRYDDLLLCRSTKEIDAQTSACPARRQARLTFARFHFVDFMAPKLQRKLYDM